MSDLNLPAVSSSYLFVTEIMHSGCHVDTKLQQLLRGQRGSGAVLLGKGRIRLQHPTLPQEVEKVSVRSIFDGYVQVTWTTEKEKWILLPPPEPQSPKLQ